MTIFQALILGFVQGITEFLPISSSGFLILIPEMFGWDVQVLAFDAIIHFATLLAVLVGLSSDVRNILKGFFRRKPDVWGRLGWMIIVATIPVVIVGFFAQGFIETVLRSAQVVGISFIVWGIVLYIADRCVRKGESQVERVGWKRSVAIGLAQVIALIPGTSRSGITITAGLFSGLNRETATRFAFLLAIPTIIAAASLKTYEVISGTIDISLLPLVVGFVSAFVTALITIQVLLSIMKKGNYVGLAVFRVVVGIFILLIL